MKRKSVVKIILAVLLTFTTTSAALAAGGYLKPGSIGDNVQNLQYFLNSHGYNVGSENGIYGGLTEKAVKEYQSKNGLVSDGIADSNIIESVSNSRLYNSDKPLSQILHEQGISGAIPNLEIRVDKTSHTLTLFSGTTPLKSYHVATGNNGLEDKVVSGDHKTPEGVFYISEQEVLSPADYYLGTRWMRVSYPNMEDADRGLQSGLIDQDTHDQIVYAINHHLVPPQNTALGGGVGIHGGTGNNNETLGDYWTFGCIGMTDKDVNEIYDYITVGTRLVIEH